ncbi:MAG: NAD(P)H-hydrate dehydratase [Bacteroidota bacterium]
MKIFSAPQIRQWDAHTIRQEPISSLELMERASLCFVNWFVDQFPENGQRISVVVGLGNNGGDGLVIARMLHHRQYDVQLCRCAIGSNPSPDFQANWERLPKERDIPRQVLSKGDSWPAIEADILIDAIFGSGLNRPLTGYWADWVTHLNQLPLVRVSVDVPSGLFSDQSTQGVCLQATACFSFERPKLAFFFPENQSRCGDWHFGSIGLHPDFEAQTASNNHYVDLAMIQRILRSRQKFDHKGTFGHALLMMGSYGKVGAAILAAKACLRSGTGRVSLYAPHCAYAILQTAVPEAMVVVDPHEYFIMQSPSLETYQAVGIGCGIDTRQSSADALRESLQKASIPLLLDADALNILARHPDWLSLLPPNSILTPHPKEFERLFGPSDNDFERNKRQVEMAKKYKMYLLLKGANSCLAGPDGHCYFNSTGNPGMATAGSGDVLSGIITGLMAQGYVPKEAAILGMYLHGLAGDIAVKAQMSQESLLAGDLIDHLGRAFHHISHDKSIQ